MIEDEPLDAELLVAWFEAKNYTVLVTSSAERGVALAQQRPFDVIIVDLQLGTIDKGFEVIRALRHSARTRTTPLVVFSNHTIQVDVRVTALHLGANYVVAKHRPFYELELVLELMLKNTTPAPSDPNRPRLRPVDYDAETNTVYLDGAPTLIVLLDLQPKLMRLLRERTGRFCNVDLIINHVYDGEPVENTAVERLVFRLRKKLGDTSKPHRFIRNDRGLGYMLIVDPACR